MTIPSARDDLRAAEHAPGTVDQTKAAADAAEHY